MLYYFIQKPEEMLAGEKKSSEFYIPVGFLQADLINVIKLLANTKPRFLYYFYIFLIYFNKE